MTDKGFREQIYAYVAEIPEGRVMTYGQLAALAGHPRAARIVGGIAHFGPDHLPWHRVVNKQGRLAAAFPGGRNEQGRRLQDEGVTVSSEFMVNLESLLWYPQR